MNALFQSWRRGRAQVLAALMPVLLGASCHGQELVPATNSPVVSAPSASSPATPADLAERGHTLFLMNCAHCHGADATGDEGPDLHGLFKSDARFSALIKNGIKGEMPRFGAKLSEAEVQALIAFIHSLK